jgi:predicted HD phosphohydrolase
MIDLDRRTFIVSLGGAAAVAAMSHDAKADALDEALAQAMKPAAKPAFQPTPGVPAGTFPSVEQVTAAITRRPYRRGVGVLFEAKALANIYSPPPPDTVPLLEPMPPRAGLKDFIRLRFQWSVDHCLQSAASAEKRGMDEEIVFACLLHDHPQNLCKVDHGHWGGQLYAPYVSERVAFAVRHHAALRFFPDADVGYTYPDLYRSMFGHDYVAPAHVREEYEWVKRHPYYEAARAVTLNDLYAFDPTIKIPQDRFDHLIEKHWRDPAEGLGFDNSSAAHLWRSISYPDTPL